MEKLSNKMNKIINYQEKSKKLNSKNVEILRVSSEEVNRRREINKIWLFSMVSFLEKFISKVKKKDFFISCIDLDRVVLRQFHRYNVNVIHLLISNNLEKKGGNIAS